MARYHRDKHGGGSVGRRQPVRHQGDAEEEYGRLLRKHAAKQQARNQRQVNVARKGAAKKALLAARRGQIDLDAENKTDYKKDGYNVQLSPVPPYWTHENLRQLLRRVNAPCPIAWNLQASKGLAWIDYDSPQCQREAISALNNLHMPGGLILSASAVDVEKKKKPAFYRECDDGRVLPNEVVPKGRAWMDEGTEVDVVSGTVETAATSSSALATADTSGPATKRIRGRGFAAFSTVLSRLKDDDPGASGGLKATRQATGNGTDGYMSDGSLASDNEVGQGTQPGCTSANTALLTKYKVILKHLNEKKRTKGTVAKATHSDEELST